MRRTTLIIAVIGFAVAVPILSTTAQRDQDQGNKTHGGRWEYATLQTQSVVAGGVKSGFVTWASPDFTVERAESGDALMDALACPRSSETYEMLGCFGDMGWELAGTNREIREDPDVSITVSWMYFKRPR